MKKNEIVSEQQLHFQDFDLLYSVLEIFMGFTRKKMVDFTFAWNQFLANLDIKIVKAGFAENVRRWSFRDGLSEEVFYRIYLSVSGSFRLIHSKGVCVVEPGALYLIPCDVLLKYEGISPCTHYWIHFVSNQLKTIPLLNEPVKIPLKETESVQKKMQQIMKNMKSCSDFKSAVFVKNSVTELLVPFLDDLAGKLPETESIADYTKILNYIDTNLHRDFTITELNAFTRLGRADFSASFRKVFGLPPKQYITMRRLNRAKYLLLETDLPIKEIARQCGYQDEFFFHRIFKRYTKIPPARYRKYSVY